MGSLQTGQMRTRRVILSPFIRPRLCNTWLLPRYYDMTTLDLTTVGAGQENTRMGLHCLMLIRLRVSKKHQKIKRDLSL